MWISLEPTWQHVLELAWGAFQAGTVPVGCVIVNEAGVIIARGQNAIADRSSPSSLAGTNLAHAEMIALSQLQKEDHPKIGEYTLYTSLEPCPMCLGASVMVGIRKIRYGARDAIAGSAALITATPYLNSKNMQVELGDAMLEVFQIALVTAFELKRRHPRQTELLGLLHGDCPQGVKIGARLFEAGYFAQAVQAAYPIEQVFCEVMEQKRRPIGTSIV